MQQNRRPTYGESGDKKTTGKKVTIPLNGVQKLIVHYSKQIGVDPYLMLALAKQESGYDQSAVSPDGALGVMQLMPFTAKEVGVNPHDLHQNIIGGCRYLKKQLRLFSSISYALAGYNAGPGNTKKYGSRILNGTTGVKDIDNQTPYYVKNILAMYQQLKKQGGL